MSVMMPVIVPEAMASGECDPDSAAAVVLDEGLGCDDGGFCWAVRYLAVAPSRRARAQS